MTALTPERRAELRRLITEVLPDKRFFELSRLELIDLLDAADECDRLVKAAVKRGRDELRDEIDGLVLRADYWSEPVQQRVRQLYIELHGGSTSNMARATAAEATARGLAKELQHAADTLEDKGRSDFAISELEGRLYKALATPEVKALMETEG